MKRVKRTRKPAPWLWMSFVNDDGFRGLIIIRARDIIEGVRLDLVARCEVK